MGCGLGSWSDGLELDSNVAGLSGGGRVWVLCGRVGENVAPIAQM